VFTAWVAASDGVEGDDVLVFFAALVIWTAMLN